MANVLIDSTLTKNPKFLELMGELNVGKRDLLWMLYQLWSWVADYYPDGNLVGVSEASLVHAMECGREPQAVAQALEKTGFLDLITNGWHIHDWLDWRDESTRSRHRRMVKRPDSDRIPTSSEQPSSPAVVLFPVSGTTKDWPLTTEYVEKLKELYPGVDIILQAKRALNWIEQNPTRKKTARGMSIFLSRWMERTQNSGRGMGKANPVNESDDIKEKWRKHDENANRVVDEFLRGKK